MTKEPTEKTNEASDAIKQLTFSEAMFGELLMLVIALVVIYFSGISVGYLGTLSLFEAVLYGFIGAGILYQVMYTAYSIPGKFMDDLKQKLSVLKVALDNMSNWQLIMLAIAAGVAEEFLFREVLQNWLVSEIGLLPGLFIASLLFGVAHAISIPYIVLTFVIGLVLGILFEYTGSLLLVMIIHAVYDAIAFMVIRYKPQWLKLVDLNEQATEPQ